jgi:hypothetical protein
MGLLDDAIREHLELKRLRGADPSEVTWEEREALGPLLGESPIPIEHDAGTHPDSDLSVLSQETVELDMRAILEADLSEHATHTKSDASPPTTGAAPSHPRTRRLASAEQAAGSFAESELLNERNTGFNGGLREGEPVRRSQRIVNARETPAGDVLMGAPDSLLDPLSQENMWIERESVYDFGFDR